MRIWGITGTNGKTTTTWILAAFIDAAPGRRCGYITTVEVFDGKDRYYTGYTTPPLARLKEIYAAMAANGCTDCVMEVSSHAIHQDRVGFGTVTTFAGGAFTNLSEDHLDYHGTMAEYFRVKLSFAARIAEGAHVAAGASAGRRDFPPFVVCLDGGYAAEMLEAVGRLPLNVLPVSNRSPRFDLAELPLVGDYNRSNVLTAAALAEAAGVPHALIQRTIPTLMPRWGRLERVANPRVKAEVFVDFAHTPDGLEKVLAAARQFCRGRLWVVFGAGGDRDPMKRPLMGAACARLAAATNVATRIAILLSDGVNNYGIATPAEATALAKRRGIKVYAIGVGTTGPVPFPAIDARGRRVRTRGYGEIDERALRRIATETGGLYFNVRTEGALQDALAKIDELEKTAVEVERRVRREERFAPWLCASLSLLCLGLLLAGPGRRSLV